MPFPTLASALQFLSAAPVARPRLPSLDEAGAEILSLPEQTEELTRELYGWLRYDSLSALLGIAIGFGLYFALILLRGWARRRLKQTTEIGSWTWVVLKVAAKTRSLFLVALSAKFVVTVFGGPGAWATLIGLAFTIIAVVQAAFWAREFLVSLVERKAADNSKDDGTISSAIGVLTVIINVVVWTIAGIILLDNLGVNVTGLVAGLGIGGIAIGLAAQGIFSDLFAALSILLDQPFKTGDTIQVAGPQGVVGTVEHIGLKTTRLRALSGEIVIISNANLLNQQINNLAAFEHRRVAMTLGVTYQTTPDQLRALPGVLAAIVRDQPKCRFDRAHFTNFGAFSLDFELIFFVEAPGIVDMLDARQAINLAIIKRFEAMGIEFAYPTQVEMQAGPDGKIFDPNAALAQGQPAKPAKPARPPAGRSQEN